MSVVLANNASGKLSGAITAATTSISLQSGNGAAFPIPAAGEWFPMTLIKATGELEIVKCTDRSADTFTVVRAQEGTVGLSFNAGDRVSCRFTALAYSEKQNRIALLDSLAKDATALQFRTAIGVSDLALDSFVKSRIGSAGALGFRNKIIDGGFDFWYEGTTTTYTNSAGYGAETLVFNTTNTDTIVVSQQAVFLGEIPTAPSIKNWSKNVVTSVVNSNSFAVKKFKIEGVRTLAGKTVTFSFYAKADTARQVAVEFIQNFGSGSSSPVNAISPSKVTINTTADRYYVTAILPSISSMTVGVGDTLEVNIWMDSGTGTETRSASLGQQSGTFYFTGVQLEEGSVMTPFEELPIEINQQRVNRYFQHLDGKAGVSRFPVQFLLSSNIYKFQVPLITPMRVAPTVTHNMSDSTFSASVTTSNKTWGMLTDGVAWSTKSSGTFNIVVSPNDRLVDVIVSGGVLGSMTTPIAAAIGGLTFFNMDARL